MNANCKNAKEKEKIIVAAKELFSDIQSYFLMRKVQILRPYICPFHKLIYLIPKDSSVLDVGCGSGLFLGLVSKKIRIRAGLGFDSSKSAINLARMMKKNLPVKIAEKLDFEYYDVGQRWPDGKFDFVSMIDVMHHIPISDQYEAFMKGIEHLAPSGKFLYKDMSNKPILFSLTNRIHDLIMARQWINYVPISQVKKWATEAGFSIESEDRCRMFWYVHEWVVFIKDI